MSADYRKKDDDFEGDGLVEANSFEIETENQTTLQPVSRATKPVSQGGPQLATSDDPLYFDIK